MYYETDFLITDVKFKGILIVNLLLNWLCF